MGTTVTLDGSGSSNPSGFGTLTFNWRFISRPPGTSTRLFYSEGPVASFLVDAPGTYVLTLTVSNGGASNSVDVTINGVLRVTVPNVAGSSQADAIKTIAAAGLATGSVTLSPSATVPAGIVISQSPVAGAQVAQGSAVNLVVSSDFIKVPDVVAKSVADASATIVGAGLVVGTTTQQPSLTVPAGSVISQSPAAGTSAAPGSAVNLVVSSGPVKVPDVVGKTVADASAAIVGAGLVVGTTTQQPSLTVPAGSVVSQSPAAGTSAAPGSAVNLVVSSGPLKVPDVVGKTVADASAAIIGAGLVVGTTTQQASTTVPAGSVISQSPAAGTSVAPGSAVNLVVSSGPVKVPDVVGKTVADASAAIVGAGLVVGTTTQQSSTTVPAGSVISQSPAAGTSAALGSAVNLVVSSGPVKVPDVVGKTVADASAAIVGAGLVLGTTTQQASTTVPAGTVISQSPAAGTSAAPGSAVNLVVSSGPVKVPDVVGKTFADASAAIVGAGLVLGTTTQQASTTVPAGTVISQSPAAGTSAAPGSAVNLVVSSGPVKVPDVVGKTFADASAAIIGAGLVVGTTTPQASTTVPAGSVISQKPAAGTPAAPGSAVNLVVSTGQLTVPDVVGKTLNDASATIVAAGLAVGNVSQENSTTVPAGTVIRQSPTAGSPAAPGSKVDLVVATSPGPKPTLSGVSANSGQQCQQNLDITITGQNTNFALGQTEVSFGAGILIQSPVPVISRTSIKPRITIDCGAALGSRDICVITGPEQPPCLKNGFSIQPSTAALGPVTPSSAVQGTTATVTIKGQNTNFLQGQTRARFGPSIMVGSALAGDAGLITVVDATTAKADIVILKSAMQGPRDVVVQTGSEQAVGANAFAVTPLPYLNAVLPSSGKQGQTVTVSITASFTRFDTTTTVDFGSGITTQMQPSSSTSLNGPVTIAGDAPLGPHTIVIQTGTEKISLPNGFSVVGPPVATGPTAQITSPSEAGEITGLTKVTGNVTSPSLDHWMLEYQPAGATAPIKFGSGTATGTISGSLDPTMLLNGTLAIILTAVDTGGQAAVSTVNVAVTRNLKVGNFTVSFNDLTIPMAGLPMQVVRTYDSRNSAKGDFGVGWTLDLKNITITTNGPLGTGWAVVRSGPFGVVFCVQKTREHVVTFALPDGTTYQFEPLLSDNCADSGAPFLATMSLVVKGSTPPNASAVIGGDTNLLVQGGVGPVLLLDPNAFTAFDPDPYSLTLPDGRKLQISRQDGLRSMTDLHGNVITVGPGGITHSADKTKSIIFIRDPQNRIKTITDPNQNTLQYSYDLNGDLTSFTDQMKQVSQYTYNSTHGLLTIKDPRKVQPIRNDYDADGRLLSHTDAFGQVINYTHDLNNKLEIVTDRLNNVTVNEYDDAGNVVKVTDALGGITARVYDKNGNITKERNALGKPRDYTYDANNNRASEKDPLGRTTTYLYNARNQVTNISDPLKHTTINVYDDATGNLMSTQDPEGNITSYKYDQQGNRTSTTEELAKVTSYTYYADGSLKELKDALGNVTSYTYDNNGNKKTETRTRNTPSGPESLITSYEYDGVNRLTKTIYPDASSTSIQYNEIGKQKITTDQLTRQTAYSYDLMGRLLQTLYPDGTTETNTYDAEGNRTTSTDRGGRTTLYVYDQLKRLKQTIYPDGTSTATKYDAIGQVTESTDARGNKTQYRYDDAGRRTDVIDALTHTTHFDYDDAGNQTAMTDANGFKTQYQYDKDNRRVAIVHPDSTTDLTHYDKLGRTDKKTDQANIATQYQYDAIGHLTAVMDTYGQQTSYAFDAVGNRISQTDANKNATLFEFDKMGRRTRRTLPAGQFETMAYNDAGNLTEKTDFNGRTTIYQYDKAARLSSKMPDPALGEPLVSFTYTNSGQRESMSDASGLSTYLYDLRDRLIQKTGPAGTLTYRYDDAGNLTSILSSNSNGTSVNYSYDELNRLSKVIDNRLISGTTTYNYDKAGNLQDYSYPNGVQSTYAYDELNRLKTLTSKKSGGTLASYDYLLGQAGNRTQVTELSGRTVAYKYDDLYRLTQETISGEAGPASNGIIGYQYDPVGNRKVRSSTIAAVPAANYAYDADDQLTGDSYDKNGNTIASSGTNYTYDFENHLRTASAGAVSIVYDGDGNRVAKTAGGVTTQYLVDDRNLTGYAQVLEELSGGKVQRAYAYGLNRISQSQANGTSFYGYDGQGSVRLLTDRIGAATDRYDYDAFGNLISQTGATSNGYLYSGEQVDPSLGLYYLRARYLSQSSGRFLTRDRFPHFGSRPVSVNQYIYASANPVANRDPSGDLDVSIVGGSALLSIQLPIPGLRVPPSLLSKIKTATATRRLSAGCPATSANWFEEVINGTLVLGRGPEGGPANCHVNAEAVFRVNWSIKYQAVPIPRYEAIDEEGRQPSQFFLEGASLTSIWIVSNISGLVGGAPTDYNRVFSLTGPLEEHLIELEALANASTP